MMAMATGNDYGRLASHSIALRSMARLHHHLLLRGHHSWLHAWLHHLLLGRHHSWLHARLHHHLLLRGHHARLHHAWLHHTRLHHAWLHHPWLHLLLSTMSSCTTVSLASTLRLPDTLEMNLAGRLALVL